MITVLVEDDLFTFYDIYEKLDKLNIFNSNYQNEMLNRLSEIQDRLEEIIYSIEDMSISIVSGLDSLITAIADIVNRSPELKFKLVIIKYLSYHNLYHQDEHKNQI